MPAENFPQPPAQPLITIASGAPAVAEIEIKRSRFIAWAAQARTATEAREIIDAARSEFPDARHHCSAFSVGFPNPSLHSSDDGEPAGTAGRPMLAVIQGSGLVHVVAVVTRYFGGTLLGTGGLVRAYSEATQAALDAAKQVRLEIAQRVAIELPYEMSAKVESEIRSAGFAVLDSHYDARGVELECAVGLEQRDEFEQLVQSVMRGFASGDGVELQWRETLETEVAL